MNEKYKYFDSVILLIQNDNSQNKLLIELKWGSRLGFLVYYRFF